MKAAPERTRPPEAGPLPRVELPRFRKFRPAGTPFRVWVAEDRQLPEVSVRLLVEAGATGEPEGRAGVAELTSRLLTEGTASRSAMEMAEWLDRLGAGFSASTSFDLAFLTVDTLTDTLEGALDFLREAVREPTFPGDELERVRQELVDELERDRDDADVVADHALIRAVYGDHRYGTPSSGLPERVADLTRTDVAGFFQERYGSADAAFVVCGDVDAEEIRDGLVRRFGDWREGSGRPEPSPPPERAREAGRVTVVDRPESRQADLRLGAVGLPYGADDFYAARVANCVLGGLFNSRINMNLREEKGWTYGARTRFHARRMPGPFLGEAAVQTDAAAAALAEFRDEIRGLWERPPTDEELQLARNSLVNSLPRQFETAEQVTRRVAAQLAYDLPEDYWERYQDRIREVDLEAVVDAARRRLDPAGLTAVVVARADEVVPELERSFDRVEVRSAP